MRFFLTSPTGNIYKDIQRGNPFRQIAEMHDITEAEVKRIFHSSDYKKWLNSQ